ncbi:MAG: metallophosphoesterase family protein [Candidatus Nanoarchaeia archaeon]
MKIAFISDLHLGFNGEESFANAEQAFNLALKEKPDLILIGGDIFHEKTPKQEIIGQAIDLFVKVNKELKKVLLLQKIDKEKKKIEEKQLICPIIGIWGTHERRHADALNPAQILEKAGLIYLLHAESILVEVGYEKIGIHGLSGVPEDYAKDALKAWSPIPFNGCYNILLIHQNLAELMPIESNAISFKDLPDGFDYYLAGHFHWRYEDEHPKNTFPILIPGSTIITQLSQKEARSEKGFFILDLPPNKTLQSYTFKKIKTRPAHYCTIEVENKKPAEVQNIIYETIEKILSIQNSSENNQEIPIIKVKLKGKLSKGFTTADLNFSQIYKDFSQKAILEIDKTDLTSEEGEEKASLLRELKDKKLSIEQFGLELIRKNLPNQISITKLENLFNFLAEEELEKAEQLLENDQ